MIKIVPVKSLSKKDIRRLRVLTLRDAGLMEFWLLCAIDNSTETLKFIKNEYAIIKYVNQKIVGWRLLVDRKGSRFGRWKKVVNIFIRQRYRGKNYSSDIINAIKIFCPNQKLYCVGNIKYFNKFGIRQSR